MPKLRVDKVRAHRITAEAVELWVRLNEISDAGQDEEFEPKGRRNEWLDTFHALNRAFGIRPWMESPLDVDGPEPPDYRRQHPTDVEAWRRSWDLRRQLEEAAARQ